MIIINHSLATKHALFWKRNQFKWTTSPLHNNKMRDWREVEEPNIKFQIHDQMIKNFKAVSEVYDFVWHAFDFYSSNVKFFSILIFFYWFSTEFDILQS